MATSCNYTPGQPSALDASCSARVRIACVFLGSDGAVSCSYNDDQFQGSAALATASMRETDGGMERRWSRRESTRRGRTRMTRRGANCWRAGMDDRRDKSNEKGVVVVVVIYLTPSVLIIPRRRHGDKVITFTASPNGNPFISLAPWVRFLQRTRTQLLIIPMQLARFVPNCHPLPSPHWYHARVPFFCPYTYSQLFRHGVYEMPLSTYPLPKRVRKQRIIAFLVLALPQECMVQRLPRRDPLDRFGV